jgi:gliding motility-associated lipoprotein GldD
MGETLARRSGCRAFKIYNLKFTIGIAALCLSTACNSVYTPKRRGYFKIDFPSHRYQVFDRPGYPYTFEYPVYAEVVRDSSFFDRTPENPYWINVDFPEFRARIYVSYKEIGPPDGKSGGRRPYNTFDKLRDDAFKMTFKHTSKASSIEPTVINTPNGVSGIFFDVGGNAATAKQFFLTDSTKNFLRGALYFDATPNEDSLSIVNNFLEKDMEHLINTFRWKKAGPVNK